MKFNEIKQDRDKVIQTMKEQAEVSFSLDDTFQVSWKSLVNRVMQNLGY